jgi:hypothetical protein
VPAARSRSVEAFLADHSQQLFPDELFSDLFMIQNTQRACSSLLVWSFTWFPWLLTMASAVLGALVWFGPGPLHRHRRRKERRQDRRDWIDRSPSHRMAFPTHAHVNVQVP